MLLVLQSLALHRVAPQALPQAGDGRADPGVASGPKPPGGDGVMDMGGDADAADTADGEVDGDAREAIRQARASWWPSPGGEPSSRRASSGLGGPLDPFSLPLPTPLTAPLATPLADPLTAPLPWNRARDAAGAADAAVPRAVRCGSAARGPSARGRGLL